MTADRKSNQGSKEEIAKGMAEAGKDEVGKAGGEAALKGRRGHGADPGKISQGMSEAGSGTGPDDKGARGGAKNGSCHSVRGRGIVGRLGGIRPAENSLSVVAAVVFVGAELIEADDPHLFFGAAKVGGQHHWRVWPSVRAQHVEGFDDRRYGRRRAYWPTVRGGLGRRHSV